ncbi:hypothetical protein KAM472_06930 [Aeromonas caviae]|nr:hypothetical protein KAM339_011460 [Aeromonas caviae]BDA19340.1 hypothetical protein KAM345_032540 [Aeromonas caviae]BDN89345.1 hypothetical protein KAM471c_31600 [Aeromonas caviae]BDO07482.1 hypothetical protein KAM643c_10550 [Aeromonas caviae]GJA05147.1 hypothetical protein KAM333_05750 [Aeromonas caviae]
MQSADEVEGIDDEQVWHGALRASGIAIVTMVASPANPVEDQSMKEGPMGPSGAVHCDVPTI